MLTGPILFNSCRPNTEEYNIDDLEGIKVDLTSPENVNLKTIGGFVYKDDPISNEQIIIIRASKTLYIALSKLCTHENCVLSFNSFTNESNSLFEIINWYSKPFIIYITLLDFSFERYSAKFVFM